jgi:hypothetical protein
VGKFLKNYSSLFLPHKTYFYVSLFVNPATLFLMEGVFIFKTQVYPKELEMRFTHI